MINAVGRDSSIDVARAVAIAGVVGGHWLVTGLVVGSDGVLRPESPLTAMPALAPVTWVLQTLGLFFFAGGFAAARPRPVKTGAGRRGRPLARLLPGRLLARLVPGRPLARLLPGRLLARLLPGRALARLLPGRLLGPLAVLVAVWGVALGAAAVAGVPRSTLGTVALLVVSPLWFLLPYLALRAVTGPLVRVVQRVGPVVPVAAGVAVVAACDLRFVPGWLAVPAAWSVPWVLGVALARARLGGPRTGALLLAGGVLGGAALVLAAGYPVSAVGVPGASRSNLNPPSLFAVTLAVAQIGLFLLVRARLSRHRPGRLITVMNRAALPIYLGHQSVLIGVTAVVALVAPGAPGLLTAPDGAGWVCWRFAWLPVFAAVLAVLLTGLRAARRGIRATVVRAATNRSGGRCRGVPVQDP